MTEGEPVNAEMSEVNALAQCPRCGYPRGNPPHGHDENGSPIYGGERVSGGQASKPAGESTPASAAYPAALPHTMHPATAWMASCPECISSVWMRVPRDDCNAGPHGHGMIAITHIGRLGLPKPDCHGDDHVKIRELETDKLFWHNEAEARGDRIAELQGEVQKWRDKACPELHEEAFINTLARAERAEADLAKARAEIQEWTDDFLLVESQERKQKARIAKLELHLREEWQAECPDRDTSLGCRCTDPTHTVVSCRVCEQNWPCATVRAAVRDNGPDGGRVSGLRTSGNSSSGRDPPREGTRDRIADDDLRGREATPVDASNPAARTPIPYTADDIAIAVLPWAEKVSKLEAEVEQERLKRQFAEKEANRVSDIAVHRRVRIDELEEELKDVYATVCNCPADYDTGLDGKGHHDWCPASPNYVPLRTWKARAEQAEKDKEDYAGNWAAIKLSEQRLQARFADLGEDRDLWKKMAIGLQAEVGTQLRRAEDAESRLANLRSHLHLPCHVSGACERPDEIPPYERKGDGGRDGGGVTEPGLTSAPAERLSVGSNPTPSTHVRYPAVPVEEEDCWCRGPSQHWHVNPNPLYQELAKTSRLIEDLTVINNQNVDRAERAESQRNALQDEFEDAREDLDRLKARIERTERERDDARALVACKSIDSYCERSPKLCLLHAEARLAELRDKLNNFEVAYKKLEAKQYPEAREGG